MNLIRCPSCHSQSLVTEMKTIPGGLDVSRKCIACGYVSDSNYSPAEIPESGPGEFTELERRADQKLLQRGLRASRHLSAHLHEAALSFDPMPDLPNGRGDRVQR